MEETVSRGFIDLQVNGYKGVDFSSEALTLDAVRSVTQMLADKGTLAYCPTLVTSPLSVYEHSLGTLAEAMQAPGIAPHLLGIHVEGPFISDKPGSVGAHRPDCVVPPSTGLFDRMQDWAGGRIRVITLAPEVPGAIELIEHCVERGVVVLLGHHYADDDSLAAAVSAGAKCSTHLGNGIPLQIPRHNNPLWWQLACDDLSATFITDSHHLPPTFVKTAFRAKTVERFIVISDAMAYAGMPPGAYESFGTQIVIEPSGRVFVPSTGGLGGSYSTMIECMDWLASLGILSEAELWQVSRDNPLRLLGLSETDVASADCREARFTGRGFNVA